MVRRSQGGGESRLLPLCSACHYARHAEGVHTFARRRDLRPLLVLARAYHWRWLRLQRSGGTAWGEPYDDDLAT